MNCKNCGKPLHAPSPYNLCPACDDKRINALVANLFGGEALPREQPKKNDNQNKKGR